MVSLSLRIDGLTTPPPPCPSRKTGKGQLRSVDKEDEPPLRKLEFGMVGETVVSAGPDPPVPHMINRGLPLILNPKKPYAIRPKP